jgi:hypothetical protein
VKKIGKRSSPTDALLRRGGLHFWQRPPEEIHEDLTRRQGAKGSRAARGPHDKFDPSALKSAYKAATTAEQAFLRLLRTPQIPAWEKQLEEYRTANELERQTTVTSLIGALLRDFGPAVLRRWPVQFYLRRMWRTMHTDADVDRRKEAKRQWVRLLVSGVPNLRRTKTRIDEEEVLDRFEALKKWVRHVRTHFHDERARIRELVRDPQISRQDAEDLLRSSPTRREALHRLTGAPFNRSASTIRELLARANRARDEHARATQGIARYDRFLRGQSLRGPALNKVLQDLGLAPLDPSPRRTMLRSLQEDADRRGRLESREMAPSSQRRPPSAR